jgi:hypothetical protein
MMCVHCDKKPGNRPRKLCHGCWKDPMIREQYAAKGKFWRSEPTPADIEAMLAEARAKGLLHTPREVDLS